MTAAGASQAAPVPDTGPSGGVLAAWAERSGRRRAEVAGRGLGAVVGDRCRPGATGPAGQVAPSIARRLGPRVIPAHRSVG
jgi:hypothetical protein